MKLKLDKRNIIVIVLILSLLINIYQFSKLEKYSRQSYYADNEFINGLQITCNGIQSMETKELDELAAMALLSSGISKACTSYVSTSYYKDNPDLLKVLERLNTNINNRTNVREIIEKNDLKILIPPLEKIIKSPLDKEKSKELYYLIIEHTNT